MRSTRCAAAAPPDQCQCQSGSSHNLPARVPHSRCELNSQSHSRDAHMPRVTALLRSAYQRLTMRSHCEIRNLRHCAWTRGATLANDKTRAKMIGSNGRPICISARTACIKSNGPVPERRCASRSRPLALRAPEQWQCARAPSPAPCPQCTCPTTWWRASWRAIFAVRATWPLCAAFAAHGASLSTAPRSSGGPSCLNFRAAVRSRRSCGTGRRPSMVMRRRRFVSRWFLRALLACEMPLTFIYVVVLVHARVVVHIWLLGPVPRSAAFVTHVLVPVRFARALCNTTVRF